MKRCVVGMIMTSVLAAALACGGDLLAPSALTLDGTWTRLDEVPGSSERWELSVEGATITGTGTWSGEACCAGSLTLEGTIARDSVHVDVTLVDAGGGRVIHQHFDGRLASRTMLVGTAAYEGGTAYPERLQKQ